MVKLKDKSIDMGRIDLTMPFTSAFGLSHVSYPSTDYVALPTNLYSDTILRFDIVPYKDTGGTLFVSLNLTEAKLADLEDFAVVACLSLGQSSRFEVIINFVSCSTNNRVIFSCILFLSSIIMVADRQQLSRTDV